MRIVVVGSGIAGLTAALGASREHEVTLVTKAELAESNTRYAQGGVAAVMFPDDSVAAHIDDTVAAGAGLSTLAAVRVLCAEGPARIRELLDLGVPFDRENGQLARGLEAAHSAARVLHAGGDATGAAIETTLLAAVRESRVTVLENTFMADLVCDEHTVTGVLVVRGGVEQVIDADVVILASGGAGQLFAHTTNPLVATGDGTAAALRAGVVVSDLEFYQFHPTALAAPGSFLVSEAVRGEGAVLLDEAGQRFMPSLHPLAELAPRDIVARAIARTMAAQGGTPVRLDATALGADTLARRFPSIDRATRALGLDWSREPIPVTPAAHYWMGGVRTDVHGRTSLRGLFAVGEVANTGAHGANRLASNSLLEALVFAAKCVEALGEPWPTTDAAAHALVSADGREPFTRRRLQQLLWEHAGLERSAASLEHAAETLGRWAAPAPDTIAAREDANLLLLARALVAAALARRESLGAHWRSDHPHPANDFSGQLAWTYAERSAAARKVA